jgi:hypothetical protein
MLRLTLLLTLAAVALPVSGIASVGQTSIFYYPWYGTPAHDGAYQHWAQDGHLPPADLASGYYPVRGPYSSGNPKVVRAQMHEIAAAGIREVVSSWWGWGSPEDLRLPLVIQSARKSGLQVAVQIEPYDKWQRTADVLENDLSHLRDLGIKRVYVYRPFDGLIDDVRLHFRRFSPLFEGEARGLFWRKLLENRHLRRDQSALGLFVRFLSPLPLVRAATISISSSAFRPFSSIGVNSVSTSWRRAASVAELIQLRPPTQPRTLGGWNRQSGRSVTATPNHSEYGRGRGELVTRNPAKT